MFGCNSKVTLFRLPRDKATRDKWLTFIFPDGHRDESVHDCARHFTTDSFVNKGACDAGFAHQLKLSPGAVPSLVELPHSVSTKTLSFKRLLPEGANYC